MECSCSSVVSAGVEPVALEYTWIWAVAAVSDRRRRSEIDATIYGALYHYDVRFRIAGVG